jgi:hypothetical protein
VGRSTLNSIRQDIAIERCSSSWTYLFTIIGVLIAANLAISGAYLLWVQYTMTLKAGILHILMRTLTEPIILMIQLPLPASALNQQLLLEPIH